MRRLIGTVLALCVFTAACGGKGTPTDPSTSSGGGSSSSSSSGSASPAAAPPATGNSGNAEAEFTGGVAGVTGTAAAFQFTVGGRLVKGDASTTFVGKNNTPGSFADLKNGLQVEVKGKQADGFVQATRIHVENENENENKNDDDNPPPQNPPPTNPPPTNPPPTNPPPTNPPPPQNQEASVTGALRTIAGTAPALTLTVNTTTVHTTSSTTVKRRGNPLTLAALQVGQTLEVEGTRRTDGSIDARSITIEDDENENENENEANEVEIEGTMSGLGGTCPSLSFSVSSRAVTTNASTEFDKTACSAFRNGDRVQVKGRSQSNGSVLATRLRKK